MKTLIAAACLLSWSVSVGAWEGGVAVRYSSSGLGSVVFGRLSPQWRWTASVEHENKWCPWEVRRRDQYLDYLFRVSDSLPLWIPRRSAGNGWAAAVALERRIAVLTPRWHTVGGMEVVGRRRPAWFLYNLSRGIADSLITPPVPWDSMTRKGTYAEVGVGGFAGLEMQWKSHLTLTVHLGWRVWLANSAVHVRPYWIDPVARVGVGIILVRQRKKI